MSYYFLVCEIGCFKNETRSTSHC